MVIKRGGHEFKDFNRPIKTPEHPKYHYAVLVKHGNGQTKLIRFHQKNVTVSGRKYTTNV